MSVKDISRNLAILIVLSLFGCKGPEGPAGPSGSESLTDPSVMPKLMLAFPPANSTGPYDGFTGTIQVRFNKIMDIPSLVRASSISSPSNRLYLDTSFAVGEGDAWSFGVRLFAPTGALTSATSKAWDIGERYTFSIGPGARDINGNAFGGYTMTFEPEPFFRVTSISPSSATVYTGNSHGISLRFNNPVDTTMFSHIHFSPVLPGDWTYFRSSLGLDSTGISYNYSYLANNTTYMITIDSTFADVYGNHLQGSYSSSFVTASFRVSGTTPANGDGSQDLLRTISVNLSGALDTASIRTALLVSPLIGGQFQFNNGSSSFSFSPDSGLKANTRYTVSVLTNLKSVDGSNLAVPYVFSFMTGSLSVVSTVPPTGAANVSLMQQISFRFNGVLDRATVDSSVRIQPYVEGSFLTSSYFLYFTPRNGFNPDTPYTFTITSGLRSIRGDSLGSSFSTSFRTIGFTVLFVNPTDGSLNVSTLVRPRFRFSAPVDLDSLKSAFSMNPAVEGAFVQSGTPALYDYEPTTTLVPSTTYRMAFDSTLGSSSGYRLKHPFGISFTTENLKILSTSPSNGTTNASLSRWLGVYTNAAVDTTSVPASLHIIPNVTGTIEYYESPHGFAFYPDRGWSPLTTYTVTIDSTLRSDRGFHLGSEYSFSFTTIPFVVVSSNPQDGETNVPVSRDISVAFSGGIDTAGINTAFTITPSVGGQISTYYGSTVVYYSAQWMFDPGTLYSVSISSNLKSISGSQLNSPYEFSFTTSPFQAVSVYPHDGSIGESRSQSVEVDFNAIVDTGSVRQAFDISPPIEGTFYLYPAAVYFYPDTEYEANTLYTVTLSTVLKTIHGIHLPSPYTFTFKTGN